MVVKRINLRNVDFLLLNSRMMDFFFLTAEWGLFFVSFFDVRRFKPCRGSDVCPKKKISDNLELIFLFRKFESCFRTVLGVFLHKTDK